MKYAIYRITGDEKEWVRTCVLNWGADFIVTRGRKVDPAELPGFFAVGESGEKTGLATYEIIGDQCELVTLDAFEKFNGIGTVLMDKVKEAARNQGCRRMWLITTNDNLDAIRFYQRRGMTIAAVHLNSLEISRKLKPAIPLIGLHGIPLRDELEFELTL